MLTSITLTGCSDSSILEYINESAASGDTLTDTTGLPTQGTNYFHPDHLGSISYLTDAEGNVVTRMSYTPYGEKVKSASTGPDMFHQKYTAQVDDGEESGLLYYNARYYDPVIGRFISADSVVPDATQSQAFNRYMYVAGNPVKYNDPTGHKWGKGTWNKVVGACTSDTAKNVGKGIIDGVTPYYAYKNGGIIGGALWFSGGVVSYSREGGYGATLGGTIVISGTPIAVSGGIHWQEKGFNGGWSVYAGPGYKKGNYEVGAFLAYNFNQQNTTIGIKAGYTGSHGSVGIGYSRTYNENGNLVSSGVYGYGSNRDLQCDLQVALVIEKTSESSWSINDVSRLQQSRENMDVAVDAGENLSENVDAYMNFQRQNPLYIKYNYSLNLESTNNNINSPIAGVSGHWYW